MWQRGTITIKSSEAWAASKAGSGNDDDMEKFWIWIGGLSTLLIGWFAGLHDAFWALLILQALDVFTGILVAMRKKTFRSAVGKAGIQRRIATWLLIIAVAVMQRYTMLIPSPHEAGGMGIAEWSAVGMAFMEFASIIENASLLGVTIPSWLVQAMDKAKTVLGLTPREPREDGK